MWKSGKDDVFSVITGTPCHEGFAWFPVFLAVSVFLPAGLWATGRLRAVSHASHAPCTSGLALVMSEVQERKKKCPVTLNVSVHTHKSSLVPGDISRHTAEPYISRAASNRKNCKIICKGHEHRQGQLQGRATHADVPEPYSQEGPTFGWMLCCQLCKITNKFLSWSPKFSFFTGPCQLYSQTWIWGRIKNLEQ